MHHELEKKGRQVHHEMEKKGKQATKAVHAHTTKKTKKHINPLVIATAYTKKKAKQAAVQLEKAVLKGKANKFHHDLKKKGKQVHRDIAKAGQAVHAHQALKKVDGVAHDAHAHADGNLSHLRALQPQLTNLSEEDKEALRMIARDAALKVLKEAARDAGFDMSLLPEEEVEDGSKATEEEYEEGEVEEALETLLSLDDLLRLDTPASSFLDRAQTLNETTTTTTTTTNTTRPVLQGMLESIREMNLTPTEAERLRTEAREAAIAAVRDAAREAGTDERVQGNVNLEALFANIAEAAAAGAAPSPQEATAAAVVPAAAGAGRMLKGRGGGKGNEERGGYVGHRQLAGRWGAEYGDEEEEGGRSFEDYSKHGTRGSMGTYGQRRQYNE